MIDLLGNLEEVLIVFDSDKLLESLALSLGHGRPAFLLLLLCLKLSLEHFVYHRWYLLSVGHAENVGAEYLHALLQNSHG